MGIGKRIREARLARSYTQEELAALLGVTKGAVANYESGVSHPKEAVLYRLFEVLSVDANFLYQDVPGCCDRPALSPAERSLLENYRRLSDYARETIDYLILRELSAPAANSASLQDAGNASVLALPSREREQEVLSSSVMYLYPFLQYAASAGTGVYSGDMPEETVEAPYRKGADFIIGVSGASMEPLFQDGDRLYVARVSELQPGDIGIFSKDGSLYVKKAGADRLISLNGDYPDIRPDSGDISVLGRVLGKVPL